MHDLSSGAINVAQGHTFAWMRKPMSLSTESLETKLVSREIDFLVALPSKYKLVFPRMERSLDFLR